MKKIYETTIINTGGRAGEVHSPDKSFSYAVASPGVKKENTTNPEQLFAAAYSACFSVGAELEVHIDGVDQAKAEELVKKAHEICPYSKATRNNIDVKLTVI